MIDATGRPQSVLVLGGGSEIARAIVAALVPGRCRTVILAGRPSERLDAAADEARAAGAEVVETVAFDTTDLAGNPTVVEDVFARHGDIDVVLAAAGALGDQGELESDPTAAADLITTNFTGLAAALLASRPVHADAGLRAHRGDLLGRRRPPAQGQLHLRVDQVRPRRLRPGAGRLTGREAASA